MDLDLVPGRQDLDRDEIIKVVEIPFPRAVEMIFTGEIRDAKTIAGLLIADRHVNLTDRKAPP